MTNSEQGLNKVKDECDRLADRLEQIEESADNPYAKAQIMLARIHPKAVAKYPEAYDDSTVYGFLGDTYAHVCEALGRASESGEEEVGAMLAQERDRLLEVLQSES